MTDLTIQQASRHAVFVQRYAGYLANLFDPYLEKLRRELKVALIDFPTETQDIRRINRMLVEYSRAAALVYGEYTSEVLTAQLLEFSSEEAEFQLKGLAAAIDSGSVTLNLPSAAQIATAVSTTPLVFPDSNGVKMLDPFIRDWSAAQVKKTEDIIRTGFILGKTNAQIVQDISGKNGYLDNQVRNSVKAMVRTATTHTSNLARQAVFEENSDIVKGYEWVSTLDSRTSSICKGLDGRIFKHNDKDKRYPPAHPNCRSATAPVLDKRYELDNSVNTRASRGAEGGQQVKADMTYYDWLKDQGAQGEKGRAFVMDVLGNERGKLFLDGGLSVERFKKLTLDEMFQPIPLDELRKKASLSLAFDRVGG